MQLEYLTHFQYSLSLKKKDLKHLDSLLVFLEMAIILKLIYFKNQIYGLAGILDSFISN